MSSDDDTASVVPTDNTNSQGQRSVRAHSDRALRDAVRYLLRTTTEDFWATDIHLRAMAIEGAENDRANARTEPQPAEPAPVVDTKDPVAEAYERGLEEAAKVLDVHALKWASERENSRGKGYYASYLDYCTSKEKDRRWLADKIRSLKTGQTT